jgi:hypothetical protein
MPALIQCLLPLAQAGSDWWADTFFGLEQDQRFVILIIAIGCVTGVICTVVGCLSGIITSVHRRREEAELKREMLDRGMSADDIARVIEASPPQNFLDRCAAASRNRKA